METEHICPSCRRPLAPDSPQGLCPECLMQAGFGTGVAPEPGEPTSSPAFIPPSLAEMAKLFPQLEIVELLGRGGMGAVYKARQPALDRWVALKVLPPQSTARPGFAERFNREARALARLSHANIVAMYEFGQVGGMPYFAMEYVEGVTLRRLVQERRLEPREALRIVPQICEALQFAHDEGVVHRDIKPENILLDKKGRVKIADFGIAKIVTGDQAEKTITQDQVIGTPHYMAPEQVEHPQTVDHRADIYSLGVVFYEMLTGELPLGKFQPPSKKVQVDVRLDEIILRALEKEPELRYQQASQFKTQVETIAATPPPITPSQGPPIINPPQPSKFSEPSSNTQHEKVRFTSDSVAAQSESDSPPHTPSPRDEMKKRTRGYLSERHIGMPKLLWITLMVLTISALCNLVLVLIGRAQWVGLVDAVFKLLLVIGLWSRFRLAYAGTVVSALFTLAAFFQLEPAFAVLGLAVNAAVLGPLLWSTRWFFPQEMSALRRHAWLWGTAVLGIAALVVGLAAPRSAKTKLLTSRIGGLSAELPDFYLTGGKSGRTPGAAPKVEHIGGNDQSVMIHHDDVDVHFVIYYDGGFSSSSRGSHNKHSLQWIEDVSLHCKSGLTLGYQRRSDSPNQLQINGRDFNLLAGRAFVLHDDATADQIAVQPTFDEAHNLGTLRRLLATGPQVQKPKPQAPLPGKGPDEVADFSHRKLTSEDLQAISKKTRLKRLDLSFSTINNDGLKHLASLKQLEWLDLSKSHKKTDSAKITDAGLVHLAKLTNLRTLQLHGNPITDAGLETLKALKQIQALQLGATKVTGEGLRNFPRLEWLRLDYTPITDDSLRHLENLIALEQLYLDGTAISDEGLSHLVSLKKLHSLNLHETKVTADGIAELKRNLPNVAVGIDEKLKASTTRVSFGPVIERVLYSVTAQRPMQGEDLDIGREIEVPAELEKAGEDHFFHWLAVHGVDVLAFGHKQSWDLWVSPKLAPVMALTWDRPATADLLAALADWKPSKAGLQRTEPDAKEGFVAYRLDTDVVVPMTFAFQTSAGGLGLLQFAGFTDNPRGVKLRYKLVQDSTATATHAARQSSDSPIPESAKAAISAAQAWLSVIDGGGYAESWKEAAALFRGGVTEKDWAKSMEAFRKPWGNLVSRKVKTTQPAAALPGAPDGSYGIMQFESSFAGKQSAVETVTFSLEKDGQWRAVGYFIK